MSKRVLGCVAAIALLATACSSGTSTSAPVHPAARACKDFNGWYLAHRSNLTGGAYAPALKQVAAQAPRGTLRLTVDRLRVADTIAAQTSGSLQATVKKQALSLALSIVKYCRSVGASS
jgi:hypothetical protein